jgi:hypothetical protein
MTTRPLFRSAARLAAVATATAAAAYGTCVAIAWRGYGRPALPESYERDDLLDRFMPVYDVVERHRIFVHAPAATLLDAAKQQDLMHSPLVRAIFKAREVALGASPDDRPRPRGLLDTMQSLGWRVLAERPDREIVVGGVTRPWEANVTFHSLPPEQFAGYNEPGDVKIVWTLRAHPVGEHHSVFLTETRAVATDATARDRFRKYWAFASPGISAIRWLSLLPLKREAERRARVPQAA